MCQFGASIPSRIPISSLRGWKWRYHATTPHMEHSEPAWVKRGRITHCEERRRGPSSASRFLAWNSSKGSERNVHDPVGVSSGTRNMSTPVATGSTAAVRRDSLSISPCEELSRHVTAETTRSPSARVSSACENRVEPCWLRLPPIRRYARLRRGAAPIGLK